MTFGRRDLVAMLSMAAAYYLSGRLGLLLAVPPGYATAVWPPSGIALAAMLAYGPRLAPGIWLGSFLLNAWTGLDATSTAGLLASLFTPTIVAAGAALQALVGRALIHRYVGYSNVLTMETGVVRLLLLGGPLACLVNATIGTAALVLGGSLSSDAWLFNWWTWWVGDSIGVMVFAPVTLVWTVRPFLAWLRQQITVTLPLLAMFTLVVTVFAVVSAREQSQTRTEFETRADELAGHLQSHVEQYAVALHALAGLFQSSEQVLPQEFADFTSGLIAQLPGLHGVRWYPMVPGNERAAFESSMQARGFPAFRIFDADEAGRLRPAARREFYLPLAYSLYSEPEAGSLGFDAASEPGRRKAIDLALQTNQAAATGSVRAVGAAAPPEQRVLVFLPVRKAGQLKGFVALVLVVEDMLARTIDAMPIPGTLVRLVDRSEAAPRVLAGPAIGDHRGDMRHSVAVHVAQRGWSLEFSLPAAYLVANHTWQAWTVLAAGLLLTSLLGVLLLVIVGRAARVQDLVAERTAQLRDSQDQARRARDEAVQASRAKSEFVANMSHEIRTPMNGIIGMTEALRDTPLTSRQQEIAEAIRFSADSLLTIVNDILDFSKIEAGMLSMEFVDVDLGLAIERVVAVLTERIQRKGLEVVLSLDPRLPGGLRADQIRLNQVLTNLVSNAVKFTDTGEIEIRATVQDETDEEAVVRISVRDTGIGIPPDVQRRLFQPFTQADGSTTRKYGGTGLGLVISKQLVELMGGRIGVDSIPGAGSTFWFSVRLPKTGTAGAATELAPPVLHGRRALVVDDNATARRSLVQRLSSWGMVAGEAADATAALREAGRAAQQGMPYELAIVDQRMPEVDGLELTRRLRALPTGAIPRVVLLQSLRGSNDPAILRDAGVDALLTKPVGQSDLHDSLTTLIAGQRRDAAEKPMQRTPTVSQAAARPWHVLVAEDNPINQMVARHQLQRLGLKPDFVVNGREAVEAMQRTAYDLILMDCQMPELDGYSATAQIRRTEGSARHTWIVAMTAHAMAGDRERCMAAGMDDYIAKPMDPKLLAAAIERFERRNAEPPAPAAAAAVDGAAPPVNLARLWDAANGDPQFVRELADLYIEQTSEQLGLLRDAVARRSAPDIERVAHRCKGGSGSCGVTQLAALFQDLERRGREEQLDGVDQALSGIEREYARVQTFLQQPLPTPDTVQ